MAKVNLSIQLEGGKQHYYPGETIVGTVTVDVQAGCTCNGLSIKPIWRTHGRGNTNTGEGPTEILFTGEWRAGDKLEYPFAIAAPAGPLTYHGHYINLDWTLYCTADIPWAFDPSTEQELVLDDGPSDLWLSFGHIYNMPGPLNTSVGQRLESLTQEQKQELFIELTGLFLSEDLDTACTVIILAIFGIPFCSIFLFVGISAGGFFALIFSLFPIAIFATIFFFVVRNWVAQRKLGTVEVRMDPCNMLARNEEFEAVVEFSPTSVLNLNGISMTLKCEEKAVSGSGTNKTTHTHVVYEQKVPVQSAVQLEAGQHKEFRGGFQIPDTAPWSFRSGSNDIIWTVEVHIDIPRWPDYVKEHKLFIFKKSLLDAIRPVSVKGGEAKAQPAISKPASQPEGIGTEVTSPASFSSEPSLAKEPSAPVFTPTEAPETSAPNLTGPEELYQRVIEQFKASTFSSDRDKIVADFSEHVFELGVEVVSIERTSSFDAAEHLKGGKTLIGKVATMPVEMQFDESRNEELEALNPGDVVDVQGLLKGWNAFDKRPLLEGQ